MAGMPSHAGAALHTPPALPADGLQPLVQLQDPTILGISGGVGRPIIRFLRPSNAGGWRAVRGQSEPLHSCTCAPAAAPPPAHLPCCIAGTAQLLWKFALLGFDGTQIGSSALDIPAALISGAGTDTNNPHTATLPVPDDALASGGLFRVKLTAIRNVTSPGIADSATTDAPSAPFGLGKRRGWGRGGGPV